MITGLTSIMFFQLLSLSLHQKSTLRGTCKVSMQVKRGEDPGRGGGDLGNESTPFYCFSEFYLLFFFKNAIYFPRIVATKLSPPYSKSWIRPWKENMNSLLLPGSPTNNKCDSPLTRVPDWSILCTPPMITKATASLTTYKPYTCGQKLARIWFLAWRG